MLGLQNYNAVMNGHKVLLITGASRGIGAATAQLASSRGYSVCVNFATHHDDAAEVVRGIQLGGGQAVAVQADVGIEADVLRLFETIDAKLGRLDALVNNAAAIERQARVEDMTFDRIGHVLATNVLGPFLCAREAIRRMSVRRGGRGGQIVNVTSRAAQLGSPGEYVDYAASKAALDALTIGLASELVEDGIRVTGVRPGIIETGIHATAGEPGRPARLSGVIPMRRPGTVDEVAQAIVWLLSDPAASSGTFVDVAGGW